MCTRVQKQRFGAATLSCRIVRDRSRDATLNTSNMYQMSKERSVTLIVEELMRDFAAIAQHGNNAQVFLKEEHVNNAFKRF